MRARSSKANWARRCAAALSLAIIVFSGAPSALAAGEERSGKNVAILFSGDAAGELAPCGCNPPDGGLSRRATAIAQERAKGPVLLIEAGGALAAPNALKDGTQAQQARDKAEVTLQAMAQMRYDAMAVGERDLPLGVEALQGYAERGGFVLLGANLVDAEGKRPFQGHSLHEVGGVRVGLFAVAGGAGFARAGLSVRPPLAAAKVEIAALKKRGAKLIIGLLAMPYQEALPIAHLFTGVDYLLQSGDMRRAAPQLLGTHLMAPVGERGISLGKLTLALGAKGSGGTYFNLNAGREALVELSQLELLVDSQREALNLLLQREGSPEVLAQRKDEARMLETLQKRRAALERQSKARPKPGAATVLVEELHLGDRLSSDPEVKKLIEARGLSATQSSTP